MRFFAAAVVALLSVHCSCAGAADAPDDKMVALDAETRKTIDGIFADWQLAAHVPGLVYGIVAHGELIAVHGMGVQEVDHDVPVTAESLFRIASMSKAFTALAILKLRDEGKISLDAPAETYVPEMKGWAYPTKDSPRITVRNLLTHSAGFVEDNPWGDRQQVLPESDFTALLKAGVSFARSPDTGMEYSNLGFAILGRIVSNVTGAAYEDYIRRKIMLPLGMTDTGYDIFAAPPGRRAIGYRWQDNAWLREPDMKDGAFGAMGGVQTSARDYAKWVSFLLSAWPPRDDAEAGPVRRSTVREIVTGSNFVSAADRNPAVGGRSCRQSRAYAMGWWAVDDCDVGRVVQHSGGYPGYGSNIVLLPDKGVGIFAFASKTYAAAAIPVFRAALALQSAGFLKDRPLPVSPGLSEAYDAARAVWRKGAITAAPLANNILMDHDAKAWAAMIKDVKDKVGDCPATEDIRPVSAMEGKFAWACAHGRLEGRVQRSPSSSIAIQAIEFRAAEP